MEHSVNPLPSALGEGQANRAGGHTTHVDADATKQHRKIQNRKNQRAHRHAQTALATPAFKFPLSSDHLLHLIQYNVFRAFISNKRTLNTLVAGCTDAPSASLNTCLFSGPYRDDTTSYPLNPNIPLSLVPTRLQQARLHSLYINLIPFPGVRDNLIKHEGRFDHWELLQDLIGELMGITTPVERQGTPLVAKPDEDEVTAGRNGLIVWGEPYDMQSWEATPGFIAKWAWAVDGCDELVKCSNRWRLKRGEEPMRLFASEI
ncbi:hypothetical protein Daus18300_010524 [Diaporthe australafricana]|uniref:Uncharacterized protein n=1 Tax=Diaporthe australafricana TaxID=127596 RepID=A0ABR3W9W4_9PEZI